MAKKTTVKPIALSYRDVGSTGAYTKLMGVLKGLSINQDDPDSTEIEAEFFDAPFDIFYEGNPVTFDFELANYDLTELPPLFGGVASGTSYEGNPNAFTSEHEWMLDFQRGFASLVLYRGLTIGTLKKDADGALNFHVTITALTYNDGTDDHMYKIVGSRSVTITTSIGLPIQQGDNKAYSNLTINFSEQVTAEEMMEHLRFTFIDSGLRNLKPFADLDSSCQITDRFNLYAMNQESDSPLITMTFSNNSISNIRVNVQSLPQLDSIEWV